MAFCEASVWRIAKISDATQVARRAPNLLSRKRPGAYYMKVPVM